MLYRVIVWEYGSPTISDANSDFTVLDIMANEYTVLVFLMTVSLCLGHRCDL